MLGNGRKLSLLGSLMTAVSVCATLTAVAGVCAELNENCVVSVLNRNVSVNPDGTWVLPNIPANFGQVRARATCVQNGVTQSGQSDFFLLPRNGSVTLPPIKLGATTPIPTGLSINTPITTLTSSGAVRQLNVSATYSDGTGADVTRFLHRHGLYHQQSVSLPRSPLKD